MTGAESFILMTCQSRTGLNFMQPIFRQSKWILRFTLRQPNPQFVAGPKRLPPAFALAASFLVKSLTVVVFAIAQLS